MEITSTLAFLVSGVSLAVALVTVSLNVRAVRKTDLEILKLKLDLEEASSRIYVPTSEEITRLMDTTKASQNVSRELRESSKEYISYFENSSKTSDGIINSSENLEVSIRSLDVKLSSVTSLLEEWIYLKKLSQKSDFR